MSPPGLIERCIEASARHRWVVLTAVLLAGAGSLWAMRRVKLDAIPDLSDPQVLVYTPWMGRDATLVEQQVTYPLVTGLVGGPQVADVRGTSMFGMSLVAVLLEEGADADRGRAFVQERLSTLRDRLPADAAPRLGPDATGVGWVYQYVLRDAGGTRSLDALRRLQDLVLKPRLGSVAGVAEVASIGGFLKRFEVIADPVRLQSRGLSLSELVEAVRGATGLAGGGVLELVGRELTVRGDAALRTQEELEQAVVRPGTPPLLLRDVATVRFGPAPRRGSLDWNGEGEAVGGIVVMRQGENALDVTGRVKARLDELLPTLPPGVTIEAAYDRSGLIERAIHTLRRALIEEAVVVALVLLLFLLHFRSALLPVLSLPMAVGLSFVPMWLFDVPGTIMSLGGIAIALGATVDAEIVMVEAAHRKLEEAPPGSDRHAVLAESAREVTPALFFSLLIIAAAFLPVFTLGGEAGRLFRPLALTKTFVMLASALLSVTFAPALRELLIRGRIRREADHPVSRVIQRLYAPFVYVALRNPRSTVALGLFAVLSAVPVARQLGHEFMPSLDEGDLLSMPTTYAGVSLEEAKEQLRRQDASLKTFPEVRTVFGKVGRAETATDPAPVSMVETTIQLAPPHAWRTVEVRRWWSGWPRPLHSALRALWPDRRAMTKDELLSELNRALDFPGWTRSLTPPIRTRIDMLSTGVRTPVGIKVLGSDIKMVDDAGEMLSGIIMTIDGTRSAFHERSGGAPALDVVPRREAMARFGVRAEDLMQLVETALGGSPVGTVPDGRARYDLAIRYGSDVRDDPEALRRLPVSIEGSDGEPPTFVPLGLVADVRVTEAPSMLRDENGQLAGYVYVDVDETKRDLGGWLDEADRMLARARRDGTLSLPEGVSWNWTGQHRQLEQTRERLKLVVPLTLAVVLLLLWWHFRSVVQALIVLLSVPFALVGSVWMLRLLDYRLSTVVWVGIIALVGLAAQTGVVMIVYIDHAYLKRKAAGHVNGLEDIVQAHFEGTVQRVRPKLMTVATMLAGLLPLLWSEGSGADVLRRIAAPMVGGLFSSAFLTLEIIPVIYTWWRYEELLWERLAVRAPDVLAPLRRLTFVQAAGWLLAALVLVSPLYVDVPPVARVAPGVAAFTLVVAGLSGYFRRRPAARRLAWPT